MGDKLKIVDEIRSFNRYYTKLLGLLNNHLLNSKYSLTEARILYEIHAHEKITATQIVSELGIDKGQLSKVMRHLEKYGLITRKASETDGRVILISLSPLGKKVYNELDAASNQQINDMISVIPEGNQKQLTACMQEIKKILINSSTDDLRKQS